MFLAGNGSDLQISKGYVGPTTSAQFENHSNYAYHKLSQLKQAFEKGILLGKLQKNTTTTTTTENGNNGTTNTGAREEFQNTNNLEQTSRHAQQKFNSEAH